MGNILTFFITILLLFYSILISFQIYTFYTFCYFIESLKVWKKPKYNFFDKMSIYQEFLGTEG